MARSFTSSDTRKIIEHHNELKNQLIYGAGVIDTYKSDIESSVGEIISDKLMDRLKKISVEEVNRNKEGIRVKKLMEFGYNTIYDIAKATEKDLEDIQGIGKTSAVLIKKNAETIAEQIRSGIKIKLNADDESDGMKNLIRGLYRYKGSFGYCEECKNLISDNFKVIDSALTDIKSARNGFVWFFTSKQKKHNAENAYEILDNYLNNGYSVNVVRLSSDINRIKDSATEEIYDDFSRNVIDYLNVLESIVPFVVENEDTSYGLPEGIAKAVNEYEFDSVGLKCTLRRYQELGVKYILHQKKVLLGDEMGLGKTIQAIAAMVSLHNSGATHFIVVCPAGLLTNWCREIAKHSSLEFIKVHGNNKKRDFDLWVKNGGVAVTTYETTSFFEMNEDFNVSLIVVDEAHYIKNPKAKRTKNVKEMCKHSERLLFMTGTALENRVAEMVELINILNPEIANLINGMSLLRFAPEFREKIAPVYYRRRREDVLQELPELIENQEWCELLPEEEVIYESSVLEKKFMEARRVSWNVDDISKSSKANRMLELIYEAADDGRKVLIFSFFLDTLDKIRNLLGSRCVGVINGSVPSDKRQKLIDDFNRAPFGTVLLSQIQSGGTGLNIQAASVVILCEPQLKPSVENQAIARAYRMGQSRNVLVHRLLCADTVDERILEMLYTKQMIFDSFADESTAATESAEIDKQTMDNIISQEIERIKNKQNTDK